MKNAIWRTILLFALLASGCAPVPGKGYWGQHVRWPGWGEAAKTAFEAVADPKTWAPAMGAALFSIGDLDEQVSDWASRHQPVFGSDASDASENLRTATTVLYLMTALAAPSGESVGEWSRNKGAGLVVGLAAIGFSDQATLGLKRVIGRERPDDSDHRSLPSGHASQAAVRATLAARNLDYITLPGWGRTTLKGSFYTLAAGTGWARVEANKHFPSDVLAGFALGHFLGRFFEQAFLSPALAGMATVSLEPSPEGLGVTFHLFF